MMRNVEIGRQYDQDTVTIATALADCSVHNVASFKDLAIHVDSGAPTVLTLYGLPKSARDTAKPAASALQPLHDSSGTAVTVTVAVNRITELPDAVNALGFIALRATTGTAGTGVLAMKS